MVENRFTAQVAEKVTRVMRAADLADVAPEDIDVFLSLVDPEPLAEEKVQRVVRKARHQIQRRPGKDGKARPRPKWKFRLSCEQLERRFLPSTCGVLEAPCSTPDSTTGVIRLWQEDQTVNVEENEAEYAPADRSAAEPGLPAETVSLVFASQDVPNSRDASEAVVLVLAWNLLSVRSLDTHAEAAQLQLAS
jgi:hypothetical protein